MKVLVIGGGMSGLTYGIMSVKNGIETVICERNSRVGKKIAVTGNGKCNIGNANVSPSCFNNSKIVRAVLSSVSMQQYQQFLNSCGVYTFCDNVGRMYPLSESASNVVDCLRHQFVKYGGKIVCDAEISSVRAVNGGYEVDFGEIYLFDKVVLACGSGSSTLSPNVSAIVGNYFTKIVPSLVPVKIAQMDKMLNGLRAKCKVTLLQDGVPVATENGEVQFKDYGLSGICVYNLSAYIARNQVNNKNCMYSFVCDLVPSFTQQQLAQLVRQRQNDAKETWLYGILHNKLAECVLKKCGEPTAENIAQTAKNFTFRFDRLLDFSMSQVTAGGIAEKFVHIPTLSLPNGVVAIGEVLNVDGLCGGNNLYFAAASAMYLFSSEQRKIAFEKR